MIKKDMAECGLKFAHTAPSPSPRDGGRTRIHAVRENQYRDMALVCDLPVVHSWLSSSVRWPAPPRPVARSHRSCPEMRILVPSAARRLAR